MLIADINRTGPVQTIVRSARRRRTCLLVLEELGLALGVVLAGVIVMLVLGTQILRWYWLPVLGIAGIAIAAYRVRARRLSHYRVAQLLDARLGLSDSLSTAWFLLTQNPTPRDAAAHFQIVRAERTALAVKLAGVFRFRGQRSWALAAALAAVAFGLFAVRYLVSRNLNFEQSLIPLPLGEVLERIESAVVPRRRQQPDLQAAGRQSMPPENAAQPNEKRGRLLSQQDSSASQTAALSGPSGNKSSESRGADDQRDQFQAGQGHAQSNSSSGAQTRPGDEQRKAASPSSVKQSTDAKNEAASNSQTSSGLMDKMKDALSSLMTKLRPNAQNPDGNDRTSGDKNSGDRAAGARDQNGQMQQDARNRQAGDEQNIQAAAQGQTTEKRQASQNQTSNESADKKSAGAHSGIGHTNGDKDIQDARQLKAMGKLAEIIGKRSASLTGDMTVETSSSNQQLKTQYSGHTGRHADLGGEINHDEIPVMYRDYIREYMQLVHQQAEKEQ